MLLVNLLVSLHLLSILLLTGQVELCCCYVACFIVYFAFGLKLASGN